MIKGIDPRWGLLGAFIVAAIYNYRVNEGISGSEHLVYVSTLLVLFVVSTIGMFNKGKKEKIRKNMIPRMVKVSLASFGLAWGAMILLSVLFLPLFGFSTFEVILGAWSFPILVVVALIVLPYVERKLQ